MSKLSQLFPPSPSITETSLPSLSGQVFLITGATSGIGLQLSRLLYAANATVYLGARSETKISVCMDALRAAYPSSQGKLGPFICDISDLSSIPSAVKKFLETEPRLDGLVHNAGIMNPPDDKTKSRQGYETQMATHALGPFLLTRLLQGVLLNTARLSGTVCESGGGEGEGGAGPRVVWVASMISVGAPKGGMVWDDTAEKPKVWEAGMDNYMQSKVASAFLAHEFATRVGREAVLSVSVNPGLIKTDLQRHMPAAMGVIMNAVFKGPKFGAYTELFALLSPEISLEHNGAFVIPWGRLGSVPCDIATGMKAESEGGTGLSARLWTWCEKETALFTGM